MKISKKILSVIAGINLACNISVIPSKAKWFTVGDNVGKSKITYSIKRNWCWAYSGSFMLKCMGKEIDYGDFAVQTGHNLDSDNVESIGKVISTIKNMLPDEHICKNSVLNYFMCKYKNKKDFLGDLGEVGSTVSGLGSNAIFRPENMNYSANKLLKSVIIDNKMPILVNIKNDQMISHSVVLVGIDLRSHDKIKSVKYWDPTKGLLEEAFDCFYKKCEYFAYLSSN